jgi:basic amino acid/polyamine antiporter, APA family
MTVTRKRFSQLTLLRALGPAASAAVVLGTMIGTGIFLKPSEVAREGGSIAVVAAAWLFGGVLSMCGALCYAELGATFPEAGGEYAYLRRAFGPAWGFLFGWMHSIVARPASAAAISAGLLRFCAVFYPSLFSAMYTVHLHLSGGEGHGQNVNVTPAQFLAVVALVAITFVNYLGVQLGGNIQIALTVLKVAAIVAIIVSGIWLIQRHDIGGRFSPVLPSSFRGTTITGFLAALAATAWAYDGWNDLNLVGSEVEEPERTFPRVIVSSMILVIVLFLLFNFVCFVAMPFQSVASSPHVASDVFGIVAGHRGALWISLAMIISALGTLNSSILSGARVDYAMARDGIFFRPLAVVHPKFRTPANALVLQCCLASVMALTGTFEDLTALVMFGSWTFYALAVLAMMRMRGTEPNITRPYKAWGYPTVPILFVIGAFALAGTLWFGRPIRSSIGILLIAAGLLFYRRWNKKNQTVPETGVEPTS